MARVKGGNVSKNRRRKVLKQAKGYFDTFPPLTLAMFNTP